MGEVGGCRHVGTEMAHLRPHGRGSGREEDDLFLACHRHHVLYDAGRLTHHGWSADGRPIFRDVHGAIFLPTPLDDLPQAADAAPAPEPQSPPPAPPPPDGPASAGGASVASEGGFEYAGRRFERDLSVVGCGTNTPNEGFHDRRAPAGRPLRRTSLRRTSLRPTLRSRGPAPPDG
jgi:hypothetical protein